MFENVFLHSSADSEVSDKEIHRGIWSPVRWEASQFTTRGSFRDKTRRLVDINRCKLPMETRARDTTIGRGRFFWKTASNCARGSQRPRILSLRIPRSASGLNLSKTNLTLDRTGTNARLILEQNFLFCTDRDGGDRGQTGVLVWHVPCRYLKLD